MGAFFTVVTPVSQCCVIEEVSKCLTSSLQAVWDTSIARTKGLMWSHAAITVYICMRKTNEYDFAEFKE